MAQDLINIPQLANQLSSTTLNDADRLISSTELNAVENRLTQSIQSAKSSADRHLARHAADPLAHEHTSAGIPFPLAAVPAAPCQSYRLSAMPVVLHSCGGHSSTVPVPTKIVVEVTPCTIILHTPPFDFTHVPPTVPGGKLFVKVAKGSWRDTALGAFSPEAYDQLLTVAKRRNSTEVRVKWYGGSGPNRFDLRSTGKRARIHATDNLIMFELPGVDSTGAYPDLTCWPIMGVFE
ncbi:putative non-structural protein 25 [Etheostoma fonticola aquareovirus]|uniref:putative non-structural protein 25 n=1 Tax=Etheostoma fonticola aquareovirus TaxID=1862978 RepID=UPI0007F13B43|nr:putative non-structural protein 25 [Etheostoma fonticola aquareovirus]ANN11957.1 putative non-structural protein 25 [Etheostoma fonticola aquareovirus]